MFFNYLSGRYFIPKQLFRQWCTDYNIKVKNEEEIIRPKYTKNFIPKIN